MRMKEEDADAEDEEDDDEDVVKGRSVLVRSDIMTVVSYIYQDGTYSPSLCRLALYFLVWCLPRQFHLSVSHIPGERYLLADFLFRGRFLPSVWMLRRLSFSTVVRSSPFLWR